MTFKKMYLSLLFRHASSVVCHRIMQNIPEIWGNLQLSVILQYPTNRASGGHPILLGEEFELMRQLNQRT